MDPRKIVKDVQGTSGGLTTVGTLKLTDYHIVFCAPPPPPQTPSLIKAIRERPTLDTDTQPPSETQTGPSAVGETTSTTDTQTPGPTSTSPPSAPREPPKPRIRESWITYPMLCGVSLRLGSAPSTSTIRIRCRDFTFVAFTFVDNTKAREVFEFIRTRTCRIPSINHLYAFRHIASPAEDEIQGWNLYDARAEFRRQGISEKSADRGWRITNINSEYGFCSTYPSVLVVPSAVSDNVLRHAKPFRSMHRIPVLTYRHPVNDCTISRSSQPTVGIMNRYSVQDELLVRACFSTSHNPADSSPPSSQSYVPDVRPEDVVEKVTVTKDEVVEVTPHATSPHYDHNTGRRLIYGAQQSNVIFDARPQTNAEANRLNNGGSENMARYTFASKYYLNIPNIHGVRKALQKVTSALIDTDILSTMPSPQVLDSSPWLAYISLILRGSAHIARKVGIEHSHVLVHCSDGWDRTSQLCALAQLMLDPYYRTIEGFIVLIEKDFLSFGHMFRLRAGLLNHESWFTVDRDASGNSRELSAPAPTQQGPAQGDVIAAAFGDLSNWLTRKMEEKSSESDSAGGGGSGSVLPEDQTPQEHNDHIGNTEATSLKNLCPVFHQFLDCVRQIQRQFPTRFEFNERFLRRLYYHMFSCQYGTFLYNSEKQRKEARAHELTKSAWGYFLSRRAEFTNPEYDSIIDDRDRNRTRLIIVNDKDVRWWHQLFNRSDAEMNGRIDAAMAAQSSIDSTMAAYNVPSKSEPVTPRPQSSPRAEPISSIMTAPASPLEADEVDEETPEDTVAQTSVNGFDGANDVFGATDVRQALGIAANAEVPPAVESQGVSGLASLITGFGMDVLRTMTKPPLPPPAPRSDEELREMT